MRTAAIAILVSQMLLTSTALAKQQSAFRERQGVGSAGLGVGLSGMYGGTDLPLLFVSYDAAVSPVVSIGGMAGYARSTYRYGFPYDDDYGWRYTYTVVGVKGAYHLANIITDPNADVYAGATVGYNHVSWSAIGHAKQYGNAEPSYMIVGLNVGGRYFFKSSWGGFAEVGFGTGNLLIGLSMKM